MIPVSLDNLPLTFMGNASALERVKREKFVAPTTITARLGEIISAEHTYNEQWSFNPFPLCKKKKTNRIFFFL